MSSIPKLDVIRKTYEQNLKKNKKKGNSYSIEKSDEKYNYY